MPMPKGFPRPLKYVKKISPVHRNNKANYKQWENKKYPIPYSAKMTDIGDISTERVRECVKHRLCMVCGIEVEDEFPWFYHLQKLMAKDAGPYHEKCVRLTQAKCPVVSMNLDNFIFERTTWEALESKSYSKHKEWMRQHKELTSPG